MAEIYSKQENIRLNLWLENVRLKEQLDQSKAEVRHFRELLDKCALGVRAPKKYSNQYVVLTERDGKYFDPIVVDAECAEEALMPEGTEEFIGNVCMPIPAREEFREI